MSDSRFVLKLLYQYYPILNQLVEKFSYFSFQDYQEVFKELNDNSDELQKSFSSLCENRIITVTGFDNQYEITYIYRELINYLRNEQELQLIGEIKAYINEFEVFIHFMDDQLKLELLDTNELLRQISKLDGYLARIIDKLEQNEQAVKNIVENIKSAQGYRSVAQRYKECNETWDEYVNPLIDMIDIKGLFAEKIEKLEKLLDQFIQHPEIFGENLVKIKLCRHRLIKLSPIAHETMDRCYKLILPLHEELRVNHSISRGAVILLADIRKGLNKVNINQHIQLFSHHRKEIFCHKHALLSFEVNRRKYQSKLADFPDLENITVSTQKLFILKVKEVDKLIQPDLPISDVLLHLQQRFPDASFQSLLYWRSLLTSNTKYISNMLDTEKVYHFDDFDFISHPRTLELKS
jgi:hypothetical protein